jgi:hypothetical protein
MGRALGVAENATAREEILDALKGTRAARAPRWTSSSENRWLVRSMEQRLVVETKM